MLCMFYSMTHGIHYLFILFLQTFHAEQPIFNFSITFSNKKEFTNFKIFEFLK